MSSSIAAFGIISATFFAQNSLGDCVCQKVMQSARHTGTAQISSVLCVGVSEWNWIKRRGLLVEGQPRGKISPRAARKFSVSQISAHPWLLYSAIYWNRGRSSLPQSLEVQRDERWVPLVIDHVTLISFLGITVNWRYWWEYNQKSEILVFKRICCILWFISVVFIDW